MEIDLERAAAPSGPLRSQVCIVGAGLAGLALAHTLGKQGIDVALLEAGGRTLGLRARPFGEAQLRAHPHRGTSEGRFRVFGGTSLRWGGQLLPLPADAAWPVTPQELAPYTAAAERLLGVDALPYEAEAFFAAKRLPAPDLLAESADLQAALSKWVPFSRRNLADTLGRALLAGPQATVYLHAQAVELLFAPAQDRIAAVLVRNPAGTAFRFEAGHFVVAAGTVETSRLLLASRSVAAAGVGNAHGQVGRNFHDHLTLPVATLTGAARASLLRELRPWVCGGTLHSAKLAASEALRKRLALNPVLAHLTFDEPEDSGMAMVRSLLLAGQFGGAGLKNLPRLPAAAMEALRLLGSAKLLHRRYVSPQARVRLYVNAAQDTPSHSRITLSSETDAAGMAQAAVDWRITEHELATLRSFAGTLRERLGALPGIDWRELDSVPPADLDDARHAMGGACMGRDPRSSVVDRNLTVHGVANLSIAGAAVFPDGSPPLPTLPLLALTLRLAERLSSTPR
jgi:choline dehydrogenase-like flavoprotein